ncbi:Tfp pilus assembly protein FimT/FimU [Ramlibacter sp.]|uniref:Tfp pilus assembly protein FimT/FimU n=1 Tax=Ramlibacter sp. TaxID=1917967 RepID=UPI0035B001AB
MRTPTSATASSRRVVPHGRRGAAGFTLVELLVVLAIGAGLAALVPPAYDRFREAAQYRDTVRAMVMDLRAARLQAQAEGREVRFLVHLADRTYGVQGRTPRPLPAALQVRATVASIELSPDHQAAIRFLPGGGATGGAIDLVRPSGAGARLAVDWFSGQVTQSPLDSP